MTKNRKRILTMYVTPTNVYKRKLQMMDEGNDILNICSDLFSNVRYIMETRKSRFYINVIIKWMVGKVRINSTINQ